VIDPSFDPDSIVQYLDKKGLVPAAILNTHGHADHIAGNAALKAQWPACPLIIGAAEADKLTNPVANLSRPFGLDILSPPADQLVEEGQTLTLAGMDLEVFDTPGHSSGHVIFLCRDVEPWLVFGGDVLFQGSIGRTDFPGCSFEVLAHSIRTRLYVLPDRTIVLPGHGPSTTIGDEKQSNPFVSG
jgi:glyoxylase-like metal-dependent hydrolase (beta-lactamase superfamily II)